MAALMIYTLVRRLMAQKAGKENRRLTLSEVSEATGISRVTLTRIADHEGYSVETETLNRLCAYFDCRIEELLEYRPDPEPAKPSRTKLKIVTGSAVKKKPAIKKASK